MLDRKPATSVSDPGADLRARVRSRPDAIREQLRGLDARQIADRVQALPPIVREEILALVERPEEVVPLINEVELVSTLRATGLADAGWLLEFASPEQRVACIDLDCWRDTRLSLHRVGEWLDALTEAGPHVLAAALDEFDPELWVLLMQELADFAVLSADAEPPDGLTEDGMVWYYPHQEGQETRLSEILRIAFSEAPERYWQMIYGAIYESGAESQEFALRWHRARLNDLGFPDRDRALRLYAPLRVSDAPVFDSGPLAAESGVATTSQLPRRLRGTLIGRALAELPPDRAAEMLGYVLAVGNAVAIADRLPLADPETVEQSLRKAVRGVDRGLRALTTSRRQTPGQVLDRVAPFDLFRIGVGLDPELRLGRSLADIEDEEETATADWDVQTEVQEPEIIDSPEATVE
ncbi:MAG: hypothetical protein JRG76_16710 [Deltaproteobacteria bacterium]|nr:hypothetical protein [Deltaproteobacteria bacterium]MBW2416141.1 hypothetical protein [Deltaproteobacteria bacterium]